jgi:hypothetical protein
LFGAAQAQPVESEFKVTGARLEPKRAAANSPVVASLSRLMHRSGADAAAVASDIGIVARFVRGNVYRETESSDPGSPSFDIDRAICTPEPAAPIAPVIALTPELP